MRGGGQDARATVARASLPGAKWSHVISGQVLKPGGFRMSEPKAGYLAPLGSSVLVVVTRYVTLIWVGECERSKVTRNPRLRHPDH